MLYTDTGTRPYVAAIVAASGALYAQSSQGLVRIDPSTGAVTVVDATANCVTPIAMAGTDLYCLDDSITRYPLSGGAATTLIAEAAFGSTENLVAMGVGTSRLYLMTYDSTAETASFYSMAMSGGTLTTIASGLQVKSEWFVVNDAGLFWVGGVPGGTSFPLMRLCLSGGAPSVANPVGRANFIAADSHDVYLPDYDGNIDEYTF
jgi:hypothetical protein